MSSCGKSIFHPDPSRGLLEHVFFLLGQSDGKKGTTCEEVQRALWDRDTSYFIIDKDWESLVENLTSNSELHRSISHKVQDYLEKLGLVDDRGTFQEAGYEVLKEKVEEWRKKARVENEALETLPDNLPVLARRHALCRQLPTEEKYYAPIRNWIRTVYSEEIQLKPKDIRDNCDFLIDLQTYASDQTCNDELDPPSISSLRRCLWKPKPVQSIPPPPTPPPPKPEKRYFQVFFEPFVTRGWSPFWENVRKVWELDPNIPQDFGHNQSFGIRWLLHAQYFDTSFFAELGLSLGGRYYQQFEGFLNPRYKDGLAYELGWEIGFGYRFWEAPWHNDFFSIFSNVDAKASLFGGYAHTLDNWVEMPILSVESRLLKVGPFMLVGSVAQSLGKPFESYGLKLQLDL